MFRKFGLLTVLLAFASLLLVAGAQAAPKSKGQTCGGLLPIQCPMRAFCQFPTGTCGKADKTGTCAPIEDACKSQIVRPVCGCDGKTYGNDCERQMAAVSKLHNGKCKKTY